MKLMRDFPEAKVAMRGPPLQIVTSADRAIFCFSKNHFTTRYMHNPDFVPTGFGHALGCNDCGHSSVDQRQKFGTGNRQQWPKHGV
jgi:hypothetical protein